MTPQEERENLDIYRREALEILKEFRDRKISSEVATRSLRAIREGDILRWIQRCRYGREHPYSIFADRLSRIVSLLSDRD